VILKQKDDEYETLEELLRDKQATIHGLEKAYGEKAPELDPSEMA